MVFLVASKWKRNEGKILDFISLSRTFNEKLSVYGEYQGNYRTEKFFPTMFVRQEANRVRKREREKERRNVGMMANEKRKQKMSEACNINNDIRCSRDCVEYLRTKYCFALNMNDGRSGRTGEREREMSS